MASAINSAVESAYLAEKHAPSLPFLWLGAMAIRFYPLLVTVALPIWLPYLFFRYGFRRSFMQIRERCGAMFVAETPLKRVWLHAASLGEWQALRPLAAPLRW